MGTKMPDLKNTVSDYNRKRKTLRNISLFFISGLLLLGIAISLPYIMNLLIDLELKENIMIKEGKSDQYINWVHPTIPVYIDFYLFHVTNPAEVLAGSAPVLNELGPYSYTEYMYKRNITFDPKEPLVSFDQQTYFILDWNKTCTSCDPFKDKVRTINQPYAILLEIAKSYPKYMTIIFNLLLKYENEEIFLEKTVHELLWGYEDPMFKIFAELKDTFNLKFIPEISPILYLQPNNTFSGQIEVDTGSYNYKQTGIWESWKGKKYLGLWKNKYGNMLNGSDGTQFPPGYDKSKKLYFFNTNMCRSIYITYDSPKTIRGIKTDRFTTPPDLFKNSSEVPENAAFCPHRCHPYGILAGSKDCVPLSVTSPITLSTPHFLIGDPYLRTQVLGLNPNKEKHGLFLSINPITGIAMQALIRLQLNVFIQPVPGISKTSNIKPAYVPVIHFSNNATIDKYLADLLKNGMYFYINLVFGIQIANYCLSGIFFLIVIAYGVKNRNNLRSNSGEMLKVEVQKNGDLENRDLGNSIGEENEINRDNRTVIVPDDQCLIQNPGS